MAPTDAPPWSVPPSPLRPPRVFFPTFAGEHKQTYYVDPDTGEPTWELPDKYAWEEELMGTSSGVPLVRLADNGYCLAVEDSAEVAIHLTEIIDAPVVVLDRPWNRRKLDEHANTNGRIVRCESWTEIFAQFPSP